MKGELRELLSNYGPVGIIWFDGSWEHNEKELRSAEVNAMIRSLQPNILINDRNKLKEDFDTPEQTIPVEALAAGRLWETCMTMNDTWGYARNDQNWKSSDVLLRNLIDIAHKGGNGPSALGCIDAQTFIVQQLLHVLKDLLLALAVNNWIVAGLHRLALPMRPSWPLRKQQMLSGRSIALRCAPRKRMAVDRQILH